MNTDTLNQLTALWRKFDTFPEVKYTGAGVLVRTDAWNAFLEARVLIETLRHELHAAIREDQALAERLREASEDDVEAALAGSYVADDLAGVERAVLLEFWNRMADRFVGVPDE